MQDHLPVEGPVVKVIAIPRLDTVHEMCFLEAAGPWFLSLKEADD